MTSNKQGDVTWEVRAVLCIFSVTEFLLFLLGLCFQQSLAEIRSWWSWEKLLHWDMKSNTSKKKTKLFWPFRVQCMFRQLETCSKQKRAGLSHILFSGYVWLDKNVYNRKIQTFSSLCLCIVIIFYLNLYLSEITPVEPVLWHKLN